MGFSTIPLPSERVQVGRVRSQTVSMQLRRKVLLPMSLAASVA